MSDGWAYRCPTFWVSTRRDWQSYWPKRFSLAEDLTAVDSLGSTASPRGRPTLAGDVGSSTMDAGLEAIITLVRKGVPVRAIGAGLGITRSEERRVGKGWG